MLWLVDGSGGESHRRRLSLSWFPVERSEHLGERGLKRQRTVDVV